MRSVLLAVLALFAVTLPAHAWDIDKQVGETNLILSDICSATVIDQAQRLVLTAYHCIDGNLHEVEKQQIDPRTGEITTKKVLERAPMFIEKQRRQDYDVVSSEKHFAEIKGFDKDSDTALLQVLDKDWKPAGAARLASCGYEYKRGAEVWAVGNPAIVFDDTVSQGIVAAPARKEDFGSGTKIPLFHTTATVIGGNSGGAMYDKDGLMIGTVTGMIRGNSHSLAVPICFSRKMIEKAGFGSIFKK